MTDTIAIPARSVPVLGRFDVAVCGGGPSGCAAAIAAARGGARTVLIEGDGHLGGSTIDSLVCVVLSTNGQDFQGIWHEWIRALQRRRGVSPFIGHPPHIHATVVPELVKYAWDDLCAAAGVTQLLHALVSGAVVEDGVVRGVQVETRAGHGAIMAERVIDCTGDGLLCHHAGVPWDQGDGVSPWAMALTKVCRIGGAPRPENWPDEAAIARIDRALEQAVAAGEFTSPVLAERKRFLGYVRGWLWTMPGERNEVLSVLSRVLRINPLDPWDLTRAEREGRHHCWETAEAWRRFVPNCEHAYLNDTSAAIGVRQSRRIRGLATATALDAVEFRTHADEIARSSWDIDVWPADSYSAPAVDRNSERWKARAEHMKRGAYFSIRYGSLVPQGVDGLLMAGRCLSAEHVAESSLRIQQTCQATGQAAGTAAVMSLQAGVQPRLLDLPLLQARLARERDVEPAWAPPHASASGAPGPAR